MLKLSPLMLVSSYDYESTTFSATTNTETIVVVRTVVTSSGVPLKSRLILEVKIKIL